jgi:hypothetical protein
LWCQFKKFYLDKFWFKKHSISPIPLLLRSCRGHDCMVIGFTTTYAISAYHYWCCEFESRSGRGVQHYVIKFVSDLWQVFTFMSLVFFVYSGFLHKYNWQPWYYWNIVGSGIKHHNPPYLFLCPACDGI